MRRSLFLKGTSVAILAAALLAVSVESRDAVTPENETKSAVIAAESIPPESNAPMTPSIDQEVQEADGRVALLTLRTNGFEPSELTLPAGKYLLVLRNRTRLDEFGFIIDRESGERLHEVRATRRRQRDAKQFLQLTPGVYLLRETSNPDWSCRITVTAR